MQTSPHGAGAPGADYPIDYEFTEDENHVIRRCSSRARTWGIVCIVTGSFYLLVGLLNMAGAVSGNGALFLFPAGIFNLVLGTTFTSAAGSLQRVVVTEGNDINLMMQALGSLSRAFSIQIWATIAAAALVLLGVLVMLLALKSALSGAL